jgi:Tfp pilus assembly protein FimV
VTRAARAEAERVHAARARAAEARFEKAQLAKVRGEKARSEKARAEAQRARPAPARGAGPFRTVSLRCASPDPGAALACADPALSTAERQLSRAYREAEAAGVPASTLERQQQRWLAARAATARQAPWAVHDVYLSRIAELQDQTRQAHGD